MVRNGGLNLTDHVDGDTSSTDNTCLVPGETRSGSENVFRSHRKHGKSFVLEIHLCDKTNLVMSEASWAVISILSLGLGIETGYDDGSCTTQASNDTLMPRSSGRLPGVMMPEIGDGVGPYCRHLDFHLGQVRAP